VFEIYLVERYANARFPTGRVYGDTPDAQLRFITCGGAVDPGPASTGTTSWRTGGW
jgi:hypothetical protein